MFVQCFQNEKVWPCTPAFLLKKKRICCWNLNVCQLNRSSVKYLCFASSLYVWNRSLIVDARDWSFQKVGQQHASRKRNRSIHCNWPFYCVSVFQSEILDAPRSNVKSSQPLEDILKNAKPTSVRSRHNDAAVSQMSPEAARVLAGLPNLTFMQSKVLMFPIKNWCEGYGATSAVLCVHAVQCHVSNQGQRQACHPASAVSCVRSVQCYHGNIKNWASGMMSHLQCRTFMQSKVIMSAVKNLVTYCQLCSSVHLLAMTVWPLQFLPFRNPKSSCFPTKNRGMGVVWSLSAPCIHLVQGHHTSHHWAAETENWLWPLPFITFMQFKVIMCFASRTEARASGWPLPLPVFSPPIPKCSCFSVKNCAKGVVAWPQQFPIGQFSKAGLHEWMHFVIFHGRSHERL